MKMDPCSEHAIVFVRKISTGVSKLSTTRDLFLPEEPMQSKKITKNGYIKSILNIGRFDLYALDSVVVWIIILSR